MLLDKLDRFLANFESWRPDGSGRVDNAPSLAGRPDAEIAFSQDELHCVRHLIFAYLPVWITVDGVISSRRDVLCKGPLASTRPAVPKPLPPGAAPCAIITVGPVGSGKSWVLHGSDSRIDQLLSQSFGARFPAPPLAEFSVLDPDAVLHGLCDSMRVPFDPTLRSYGNFMNHENFVCAIAQRRHLIFDGSGRDPVNICGRVGSRLRAAGYRIVFLVVLTSFATARRRAIERERRTGRATSEGFTRFVYASLQKSIPIYLKNVGDGPRAAADGALLYTNETDGGKPRLEHTLDGAARGKPAHKATLDAALALCDQLLTLPPEPPSPTNKPPPPPIDDDDSALSMGELLAVAGTLVSRLNKK